MTLKPDDVEIGQFSDCGLFLVLKTTSSPYELFEFGDKVKDHLQVVSIDPHVLAAKRKAKYLPYRQRPPDEELSAETGQPVPFYKPHSEDSLTHMLGQITQRTDGILGESVRVSFGPNGAVQAVSTLSSTSGVHLQLETLETGQQQSLRLVSLPKLADISGSKAEVMLPQSSTDSATIIIHNSTGGPDLGTQFPIIVERDPRLFYQEGRTQREMEYNITTSSDDDESALNQESNLDEETSRPFRTAKRRRSPSPLAGSSKRAHGNS